MRTIAFAAILLTTAASLGGCMTTQEAERATPAQKAAENCHDTAIGVGVATGIGLDVVGGIVPGFIGGVGSNQLIEHTCPSPSTQKVASNNR